MLSFWISFCELYFLSCSLTSQPFAIATELPVNHTLSFVENLKKTLNFYTPVKTRRSQ
jgi:hypothetical protein